MPESAQTPRSERSPIPELTPARAEQRIAEIRQGWGVRFNNVKEDPENIGDPPQELYKKSWRMYFSDLARMSGATATSQQETICRGWAEALRVLSDKDSNDKTVGQTRQLFGVTDDHIPTTRDLINYTNGRLPIPKFEHKPRPATNKPPAQVAPEPTKPPDTVVDVADAGGDIADAGEPEAETTVRTAGVVSEEPEPTTKERAKEAQRQVEEYNRKLEEEVRQKMDEDARKAEAEFREKMRELREAQTASSPKPDMPHTSYSAPEADPALDARRAKEKAAQERLAGENAALAQKIRGWQKDCASFWDQNWQSVRQHGVWFHRSDPEKERHASSGAGGESPSTVCQRPQHRSKPVNS